MTILRSKRSWMLHHRAEGSAGRRSVPRLREVRRTFISTTTSPQRFQYMHRRQPHRAALTGRGGSLVKALAAAAGVSGNRASTPPPGMIADRRPAICAIIPTPRGCMCLRLRLCQRCGPMSHLACLTAERSLVGTAFPPRPTPRATAPTATLLTCQAYRWSACEN